MSQTVDVVIPAHNAAETLRDTIRHISEQQLPEGWQICIYVSDDGSTDSTPNLLAELQSSFDELQSVRSNENRGRSHACNAGVAAGSGAVVVICDADCRYTSEDAIAQFLKRLEQGADVAIGLVELGGEGFWARYTNSVTAKRVETESTLGLMAYTTANFAVRRAAFEQLQGFSPDYGKYGFECA